MVSEPASGNTEELTFRRVTGKPDRAVVAVDSTESHVAEFLIARWIWLDDRTELRQLRVIPGPDRSAGYERLDNEILAGRRLHEVTEGVGYPPVLSHLYGDEAESADPYALLEPYRGEPLDAVVGQMMKGEQLAFEVSLLTGLGWLEAAGIAHRGLSPSTVRWDGRRQQAQITDFSLSTVFRVPREAIGPADWVGPEQRPGEKASGLVTERDDMHAAGRLIYYVRSQGEQLQSASQLAGDAFADLVPLFGQPDRRPTARALLAGRPGVGDPIPRGFSSDARLKGGYERFDFWRQDKHPGVSGPEDGHSAGSGAAEGASGGMTPTQMPLESAPTGPVVSEAAVSWEPADQDKRSWWRRGGRS
jgi:serine/threonine protein kinase